MPDEGRISAFRPGECFDIDLGSPLGKFLFGQIPFDAETVVLPPPTQLPGHQAFLEVEVTGCRVVGEVTGVRLRERKGDWLMHKEEYSDPSTEEVTKFNRLVTGSQPEIDRQLRALHGKAIDADATMIQQHRRIGRNDRCPCESGKKFKQCCLAKA